MPEQSFDYSGIFIMLGYKDSNLKSQIQKLMCYHYTIAQFLNAVQR